MSKLTLGLFLIPLLVLVATTECSLCGNEIVSKTDSPRRARTAVLFKRDCGATTGVSSQVSILEFGESLPNAVGNTLITNAKSEDVVVAWLSDTTLQISYPRTAEVFKEQRTVSGISIRFVRR